MPAQGQEVDRPNESFESNVFVNCPNDTKFYPLLRPLLFTVIYAGLNPRLAIERMDSGEPRIEKIVRLIDGSKYAIHDLSRMRAKKAGDYFRLNMAFELGLDVGCRLFKGGRWSGKKCLILEKEKYRYQTAISDLSNSDIAAHGNDPDEVVVEVRNWLNCEAGATLPGPAAISAAFDDFMGANYDELIEKGYSDQNIEQLPINELIRHMRAWVTSNKT